MGKISISPENHVKQYESFPRLKLEAGEKALISIHEDPTVVYVHTLRRPKIVNGKPEMKTVERKDKTTFETNEMDFVSRPQCLGDEGILAERGVDPKNCPACAVAKKNDSVDAPQLRYAVPVFKYATKGGTWDLGSPFGGQVVVWAFTVKMFNKLIEIVKENEAALTENDLKLECISKVFQTYEVSSSVKAKWQQSAASKSFVEQALADNQPSDLEGMCGRKSSREAIQDDIDSIEESWKIANGTADEVSAADQANLAAGLQGLMDTVPVPAPNPSGPTPTPPGPGSPAPTPAPNPGNPAPAAGGADGFAELMALAERSGK